MVIYNLAQFHLQMFYPAFTISEKLTGDINRNGEVNFKDLEVLAISG
jgi:hypothetical protein